MLVLTEANIRSVSSYPRSLYLKSLFSSGLPKRDRVKADILRVCLRDVSILKSLAEPGLFSKASKCGQICYSKF
jgi:hypothetical protein